MQILIFLVPIIPEFLYEIRHPNEGRMPITTAAPLTAATTPAPLTYLDDAAAWSRGT
jgi:hypothetical protein